MITNERQCTQGPLQQELPKPEHSGYCIYYGLMSKTPDSMVVGDSYEITFDGFLMLLIPLQGGELLFVMCHPQSLEDDPNAWR